MRKTIIKIILLVAVVGLSLGCIGSNADKELRDVTEESNTNAPKQPPTQPSTEEAASMEVEPGIVPPPQPTREVIIPYNENYVKPGETVEITGQVFNYQENKEVFQLVPIAYDFYGQRVIPTDWVEVSPSTIELDAGETGEFVIKVSVPEDAKAGWYQGMLAIRSQTRPEQTQYYSVCVYEPLEDPIEQEFNVPADTSKIQVTVSWTDRAETETDVAVTILDPDGNEVGLDNRTTQISGWISAINYGIETVTSTTSTTITYTIDDPEPGTYALQLLPDGPASVSYNIVINPTDDN